MRKIVLINVDFRDAYTGEIRRAGDKAIMDDERIAEVRAINPEFVSVIGMVEEPIEEPIEEIEEVIEEIEEVTETKGKAKAKSK